MYKNFPSDIKKLELNASVYSLHKKGIEKSDFGMDNCPQLLDGGFGLYSTADLKKNIGPMKTEYFRVSLTRSGSTKFNMGLEKYETKRNTILFGSPGQVFSLYAPSDDFFAYYMLFSEEFILETFLIEQKNQQFPFLSYLGNQCFDLSEDTAVEIENIILKMNQEIKNAQSDCSRAIKLYIQLIFILANRHYKHCHLDNNEPESNYKNLFKNFVKLVGQHFLSERKVANYADMLHVSPDYLNRAIKTWANKTAHELIAEMILIEAKVYLLHSKLSIAEIAYKLNFADPSHFNKFFKKLSICTPLQFRAKSK